MKSRSTKKNRQKQLNCIKHRSFKRIYTFKYLHIPIATPLYKAEENNLLLQPKMVKQRHFIKLQNHCSNLAIANPIYNNPNLAIANPVNNPPSIGNLLRNPN